MLIHGWFTCSVFLLCLNLLWPPPPPLLHLWLLCAPQHHSSLQWLCLLSPLGQITSQHDLVKPPQFIQRDTMMGSASSLICCSNNDHSPRCLFRHMPTMSWVLCGYISLSELSLPIISYVMCWCLLQCLLYAFRFPCGCCFHLWGLNHCGLQHCRHSEFTLGRHMCLMVMVFVWFKEYTEWLLLQLPWVGGHYATL